jgi:hypothetical protein
MAQCYRFESVNSTVLVSVYDRRADLQQIVTKTLADLVCGILSRRNMIDINPPRRLQFHFDVAARVAHAGLHST